VVRQRRRLSRAMALGQGLDGGYGREVVNGHEPLGLGLLHGRRVCLGGFHCR
jgi:hypothetical protein